MTEKRPYHWKDTTLALRLHMKVWPVRRALLQAERLGVVKKNADGTWTRVADRGGLARMKKHLSETALKVAVLLSQRPPQPDVFNTKRYRQPSTDLTITFWQRPPKRASATD